VCVSHHRNNNNDDDVQDALDIAQVQSKVLQELDVLPAARASTPFLSLALEILSLFLSHRL
jgi:hypothetical protein